MAEQAPTSNPTENPRTPRNESEQPSPSPGPLFNLNNQTSPSPFNTSNQTSSSSGPQGAEIPNIDTPNLEGSQPTSSQQQGTYFYSTANRGDYSIPLLAKEVEAYKHFDHMDLYQMSYA